MKTSSKSLFDSYMKEFRPEQETCPVCGSTGNCHIHAYYGSLLTDIRHGERHTDNICILRVICSSCGCTHAILPDLIIPYSSYGIFFILRVLALYFSGLYKVTPLCEMYGISLKLLYHWLRLFREHKKRWLGLLADTEISHAGFLRSLTHDRPYSPFSMEFVRRFSYSFLQSHKNPVPIIPGAAHYCQTVFRPDIVVV